MSIRACCQSLERAVLENCGDDDDIEEGATVDQNEHSQKLHDFVSTNFFICLFYGIFYFLVGTLSPSRNHMEFVRRFVFSTAR